MAEEFFSNNAEETQSARANALRGIPITREPHVEFKERVPSAIGLIRTGGMPSPTPISSLFLLKYENDPP
jgi:D-ribose pyranase